MQKVRATYKACLIMASFFFATLIKASPQVCIQTHCYDIEIAKNRQEQELGLMHRTRLPQNAGMLFVYPEERPIAMWMKNTHIPLDIIWISSQNRILHIQKRTKPFDLTILSCTQNAQYVLEINGGEVDKNHIKVGQKIRLKEVK